MRSERWLKVTTIAVALVASSGPTNVRAVEVVLGGIQKNVAVDQTTENALKNAEKCASPQCVYSSVSGVLSGVGAAVGQVLNDPVTKKGNYSKCESLMQQSADAGLDCMRGVVEENAQLVLSDPKIKSKKETMDRLNESMEAIASGTSPGVALRDDEYRQVAKLCPVEPARPDLANLDAETATALSDSYENEVAHWRSCYISKVQNAVNWLQKSIGLEHHYSAINTLGHAIAGVHRAGLFTRVCAQKFGEGACKEIIKSKVESGRARNGQLGLPPLGSASAVGGKAGTLPATGATAAGAGAESAKGEGSGGKASGDAAAGTANDGGSASGVLKMPGAGIKGEQPKQDKSNGQEAGKEGGKEAGACVPGVNGLGPDGRKCVAQLKTGGAGSGVNGGTGGNGVSGGKGDTPNGSKTGVGGGLENGKAGGRLPTWLLPPSARRALELLLGQVSPDDNRCEAEKEEDYCSECESRLHKRNPSAPEVPGIVPDAHKVLNGPSLNSVRYMAAKRQLQVVVQGYLRQADDIARIRGKNSPEYDLAIRKLSNACTQDRDMALEVRRLIATHVSPQGSQGDAQKDSAQFTDDAIRAAKRLSELNQRLEAIQREFVGKMTDSATATEIFGDLGGWENLGVLVPCFGVLSRISAPFQNLGRIFGGNGACGYKTGGALLGWGKFTRASMEHRKNTTTNPQEEAAFAKSLRRLDLCDRLRAETAVIIQELSELAGKSPVLIASVNDASGKPVPAYTMMKNSGFDPARVKQVLDRSAAKQVKDDGLLGASTGAVGRICQQPEA